MSSERTTRTEELFQEALERTPEERERFLEQACGGDASLLADVRALLRADDDAGSLFDTPAIGLLEEVSDRSDAARRIDRTVGPFRLQRVIGSGGMGTVYEAEQASPRRLVALKMMRSGMRTASALRRFQVEAEILARLHHPSIAQVYEAGMHEEDGRRVPYFAMEIVHGARTVLDFAEAQGLGTRERLELFAPIADAVHHGHQKGVIHRDLKPSNVLVDASGVPKVIDFGVARATDAEAITTVGTEMGRIVGTVQYMSPEAFQGDPHALDTRSDVYSLGVILYELLAGRPPHDVGTTSLPEAARVVQETAAPRPSRIRRELRGDLETIMLKALEKDRERRYPSAAALGQDLRRFLANEPIEARPPSALYQARKLVSRHKVASALVAVLVLAIAGFGIAMAILAREAREEAQVATQVTDFMVDLFEHASPNTSLGEDVPVRYILDQGARRIDSELADQPLVRARLLNTLGHTYHQLGSLDEAERMFRQALEARSSVFGPEDEWSLHYRVDIAGVMDDRGDFAEAERELREVLGIIDSTGVEEPVVAYCLGRLGFVLLHLGAYDEAEVRLREAIELERGWGGDREATASAINGLAGFLHQSGRDAEALPLFQESLAIYARVRPAGDPDSVPLRLNLARCLAALDRGEEALEQVRLAAEDSERMLGVEHPRNADVSMTHAHVLIRQGRYGEAEEPLREALALLELNGAGDRPRAAWVSNDLGQLLRKCGRYDEAVVLLRRAVAIFRRRLPDDHASVSTATMNLADALSGLGELAEAESLAREALAIQRRVEPGEPSVGIALGTLSWVLILEGRLDEAERAANEGRELLEGRSARSSGLGLMYNRLALIHNMQGRAALAERECRLALECFERVRTDSHQYVCYTPYQLGWALLQQGDRDGAETAMRESIAEFRRVFPGGHPDLAWPLNHLGEVLLAERPDEATELFEEALALRRRHGADAHWLSVSLVNLAVAYHTVGRSAEALPLSEEAIRLREGRFGFPDPNLANALNASALILAAREEYERAAARGVECLEHQRALYGERGLVPLRTQSLLGEIRIELGELEEAELLLLEVREGLRAHPGEEQSLRETLERLVRLYARWERPDEVQAYEAKLAALGG